MEDGTTAAPRAPLHDNFHTAKSIKADKFPIDGLKPKLICASARSRFKLNFFCLRLRRFNTGRASTRSFHVSYLIDGFFHYWVIYAPHNDISLPSNWLDELENIYREIRARKLRSLRGRKSISWIDIENKSEEKPRLRSVYRRLSQLCNLRTYHKRTINSSTRDRRSEPLFRFRVDLFVSLVVVVACEEIKNHQNLHNFIFISRVSQLIKS